MSAVRHTARTRARAIQLHEGGWSLQAIRRVLAAEGVRVHTSTIWRWVGGEKADQARVRDAARKSRRNASTATFRWPGPPKTPAWLLGRMRVLRGAGVPCASIARVVSSDHGLTLTEAQVRYALQAGHVPALKARR